MTRTTGCYYNDFKRNHSIIQVIQPRIGLIVVSIAMGGSVLSACTLRSDHSYSTKVTEMETAPAAEAVSQPAPPSESLPKSPPASLVEDLKTILATELGVPSSSLLVEAATVAEWNDACLGVPHPEEMCAQVITPGYRIVLSTSTETYEFHTDETGKNVRRVRPSSAVETEDAASQTDQDQK